MTCSGVILLVDYRAKHAAIPALIDPIGFTQAGALRLHGLEYVRTACTHALSLATVFVGG